MRQNKKIQGCFPIRRHRKAALPHRPEGPELMTETLKTLQTLSSAEDFFKLLDVPYDAEKVNVLRMHIMKRMGQYLASEDFEGLDDAVVRARCKETLERAYEDFQKSDPLKERVFKVLKDAVKEKAPPAPPPVVPFSDLLK
jgi:nitrogenase-stabilizing/protective protein